MLDTLTGDGIADWHWDCPDSEIEVAASAPIEHAEPAPLAALAAWAAHQRANGKIIRVADSVRSPYAWRFGILSALTGAPASSQAATRFLPPTQIESDVTLSDVLEHTVGTLGLTALGVRVGTIKAMSEAIRNVFEHSASPHGAFVCASYFPARDRVSFAVADTGVGVPSTIRRRYGLSLTDAQANETAIQLKTSAGSPADNAGIGLFFLRTMSARSSGLFALVSGSAFVKGASDYSAPQVSSSPVRWNGTVVSVTLSASRADDTMNAVRLILERGLSADRKQQLVTFGDPPPGVEVVRIEPTAAGIIEDKTQARLAREQVLLPAVATGRPVAVDLSAGQAVTHSFVHALLFAVIKQAGERSRQLVFVRAATGQVRDTVRLVAWDAANSDQDAATLDSSSRLIDRH